MISGTFRGTIMRGVYKALSVLVSLGECTFSQIGGVLACLYLASNVVCISFSTHGSTNCHVCGR